MGEYRYNYETTINYPLETVWAALHKTADLDLSSGTEVTNRISDSEWICRENETGLIMENKATYDEANHEVHVVVKSSTKRQLDETTIRATADGNATHVEMTTIIRGGMIAIAAVKLLGAVTLKKMYNHVADNISSICAGGGARVWNEDDFAEVADERFFK